MPFLIFLKSFEVLLYEVMSWLVFYPRTMWRAVRHPLHMMKRTEDELKLAPAEQFRDVISPPIFLLLTVIVANTFEVAIVGNNALIDDGVGLAAMITDNTSLILFRLIVFASLPVVAGVFALAAMRRRVDRDTLQPLFYAQCFATTPVVLLCSIAATITRLPQPAANIPAAIIFAAAALFYIVVEASWFVHEARRRPFVGVLWAFAVFAMSVLVVGGVVLLFAGL
ncbi:MAG: hypothetical protein ABI454_10725 [Sphingomicrobium sp.]